MNPRDLRRLKDILSSTEKIQKYVNDGKESFLKKDNDLIFIPKSKNL